MVTLIPTRTGNGAMEALAAEGAFRPPPLDDIERTAALALTRIRGRERIFVDVWDLEPFSDCAACFTARRDRLHAMNLEQRILPPIKSACCAATTYLTDKGARMNSLVSFVSFVVTPLMTNLDTDIAIVGSGFAGSLTALALRRLGMRARWSNAAVIPGSRLANRRRRSPTC